FGLSADLQREIDTRFLIDLQDDVLPGLGLESGHFYAHFILSDVEQREVVVARVRGDVLALDAGSEVQHSDFRARYHGAGGVGDGSENGGGCGLGWELRACGQKKKNDSNRFEFHDTL